jgi:large subunit ribosomal protein L23
MSIFDAFKSKRKRLTPKAKPAKKLDIKKAKVAGEVKEEKVLTPDGRLVTTTKKVDAKPKKAKIVKEDTGDAYRVLRHPLITEKGSWLGAANKYAFAVAPQTNKVEVRKAIRKVYGVDPVKVNIMNIAGKKVRYGRTSGQTKNWKKAIVTLAAGQKIEIQEGL